MGRANVLPFLIIEDDMARKESEYVTLKLKWDAYIKTLISNADFNLINSGLSSTQIKDDIYSLLTNNDFDSKGFKFIFDAVKIDNPKMTEKQFMNKYVNQKIKGSKINILDNIDNKATTDRVHKRLTKDIGILQGRVDRLASYKVDISQARVKATIADVKQIVDTNKTITRNLENKIKDKSWVLRRKDLSTADKRSINADIKILEQQLKSAKASNKALSKQFKRFNDSYVGLDENALKKAYTKLLDGVSSDIINRQQSVVVEQALQASASQPMKRTAQTEFVKSVTQNDLAVLNDKQDKMDGVLLVKYTLSPSHNIYDICDIHATGGDNGDGVYPLNDAPIPIEDSHPNCKCSLVEV